MEYIREFLKKENRESFDRLWEDSPKLVWVDWREEDDSIINYVEKVIQSGKLKGKIKDADNKMGYEIIIEWEELEKDFGEERVSCYFSKIDENSKMFDLDMDELYDIIEERKEIN